MKLCYTRKTKINMAALSRKGKKKLKEKENYKDKNQNI